MGLIHTAGMPQIGCNDGVAIDAVVRAARLARVGQVGTYVVVDGSLTHAILIGAGQPLTVTVTKAGRAALTRALDEVAAEPG